MSVSHLTARDNYALFTQKVIYEMLSPHFQIADACNTVRWWLDGGCL